MIIGVFAWWWFGSDGLGLVIAAAMVINLMAAALARILVPLTLDHFDIDPAIASGKFVTTVTDLWGFSPFWDWRRSGFCELAKICADGERVLRVGAPKMELRCDPVAGSILVIVHAEF